MAADSGVVDTGVVVDLEDMVAIGDGDMVVDIIIHGDGDGDMVTDMDTMADTGAVIILTTLLIHIMEIPPMGKDMHLIQEDMGMEMATTEHLQQEITGTAPPPWAEKHLDLMID